MIKNILKKVRRLEISTKNKVNSLFSGNYRSAFKGRGIEFADIRPYDIGDDVRDIDWKTTSKQGELYVKTYHESRNNTIFVVIDGSLAMNFSSTSRKKYEMLLETFALLSFAAVQNGDRVGILFYGQQKSKIFPPKKGRRNILKILNFCIGQYQKNEIEPFFSEEQESKEKIFRTTLSLLNHSASIFWMTGDYSLSKKMQRNIKMLKIKHDFIPILFSDPAEENWKEAGEFVFQDSYTGKIVSMNITSEGIKNYQRIRRQKKQKFQKFFQSNRMNTLFIGDSSKIFQKLFLFFQNRQKHFL